MQHAPKLQHNPMTLFTKSTGVASGNYLIWWGGMIIAAFANETDCDYFLALAIADENQRPAIASTGTKHKAR